MKQVPVVFQIISYVHGEKNLKTIFIWIIRVYRYIGHCVQTDSAKNVWTRAYLRDRPFNLQGGVMVFCFVQNFFLDNTRVRIFIFFVARIFFPEFNIKLYDKYSESDYFFSLHQNQNIFSATLRIRIFFLEKTLPLPPPFQVKWSFPNSGTEPDCKKARRR